MIPEGLIEHIPEMHVLIGQLNEILANEQHNVTDFEAIAQRLDPQSRQVAFVTSFTPFVSCLLPVSSVFNFPLVLLSFGWLSVF